MPHGATCSLTSKATTIGSGSTPPSATSLRSRQTGKPHNPVSTFPREGQVQVCPFHEYSSPLPLWRRRLRTHVPAIVLDGEDVAVEGRRPLFAFHGHPEVSQSVTEITLDLVPIELRIMVDHIGGGILTQPLLYIPFQQIPREGGLVVRAERGRA